MGSLTEFLAIAAAVIITPGQDTALTVRNAVRGGVRGGVCTAAGVITGQLVWALAVSAGLAAFLMSSERWFTALRLAGAVYLGSIGVRAIWRAASRESPATAGSAASVSAPPAVVAYRQGLVSNLANPKIAVFFTSLFPQFVGPGSLGRLALLGGAFAAMTFVWLCAYAAVVARLGDLLRRGRAWRALEAATGVALVAMGLRIATDSR